MSGERWLPPHILKGVVQILLVPIACAILLYLLLNGVSREGFVSSEVFFTDFSAAGLAIMPASCASNPSYFHSNLTAHGNGFLIASGQFEYGVTNNSMSLCATNTTGGGYGGGGSGLGGGTSPLGGDAGRYGAGGGGAASNLGAPESGGGAIGVIAIRNTTSAGVIKRYLLVNSTTTATTWTVPADWNNSNNIIRCVGGGGSGGSALGSTAAATGGGGGGFSSVTNVTLTPGANITYKVGAGGNRVPISGFGTPGVGIAGGDTWFNGATLAVSSCGAKGGAGGNGRATAGSLAAAAGGAAASGVGSVRYSGGSSGGVTASTNRPASGGGGAAGDSGNGGNSPSPVATGVSLGGTGNNGNTAAGAHGTQLSTAYTYFIPANTAAEMNAFKARSYVNPNLKSW